MSSIVPPLDFIPTLPGKAAALLMQQIDIQMDNLLKEVSTVVQDSIKLPSNIQCNDPRIQKIKTDLTKIQGQIVQVQQNVPKIQQTVDQLKTAVQTAQAIRAVITAAQLSNPITAPVFIAQNLMAIQDALIVNSIGALESFSTLPTSLASKFQTLIPVLSQAIQKLNSVCNLDETIPDFNNSDIDYNDLIDTEFYNEQNVSDDDLQFRSDAIQQLVEQQRDLMTSLLEAPSQVYKESGLPSDDLGKPGDYYVDISTNKIYGPKTSVWGTPVN